MRPTQEGDIVLGPGELHTVTEATRGLRRKTNPDTPLRAELDATLGMLFLLKPEGLISRAKFEPHVVCSEENAADLVLKALAATGQSKTIDPDVKRHAETMLDEYAEACAQNLDEELRVAHLSVIKGIFEQSDSPFNPSWVAQNPNLVGVLESTLFNLAMNSVFREVTFDSVQAANTLDIPLEPEIKDRICEAAQSYVEYKFRLENTPLEPEQDELDESKRQGALVATQILSVVDQARQEKLKERMSDEILQEATLTEAFSAELQRPLSDDKLRLLEQARHVIANEELRSDIVEVVCSHNAESINSASLLDICQYIIQAVLDDVLCDNCIGAELKPNGFVGESAAVVLIRVDSFRAQSTSIKAAFEEGFRESLEIIFKRIQDIANSELHENS
ncbi:MAG TPA: hypothetical protein VNX65_02590 [Patescibacteria group bacterium]|jgi:hypothetical protein|nr:hypothetical protein [Patescibacteria group bacterium]